MHVTIMVSILVLLAHVGLSDLAVDEMVNDRDVRAIELVGDRVAQPRLPLC